MSVDPAKPPDPPLSGEDNRARELGGIWGIYGAAIAFSWSAFVLWTSWRGPLPSLQHDALFLGIAFALGFVSFAATARASRRRPTFDIALVVAAVSCCTYTAINWERLISVVSDPTTLDYAVGTAVILRRLSTVAPVSTTVALRFGAY